MYMYRRYTACITVLHMLFIYIIWNIHIWIICMFIYLSLTLSERCDCAALTGTTSSEYRCSTGCTSGNCTLVIKNITLFWNCWGVYTYIYISIPLLFHFIWTEGKVRGTGRIDIVKRKGWQMAMTMVISSPRYQYWWSWESGSYKGNWWWVYFCEFFLNSSFTDIFCCIE